MRRFLCWMLIVMMTVMASGCGLMDWIFPEKETQEPLENGEIEIPEGVDETTDQGQSHVMYVSDMRGEYVIPITFEIPKEEGIAKAVVRHLVDHGPAHQYLVTKDLRAVLPAGTEVMGMTIRDGLCTVDLSEELLETTDDVHERLILDALVFTLTEFSTVDSVTIWVNGHPLTKMNHGTPVSSVLTRERGVNSSVSVKGTGAMVTVYMRMDSAASGGFLVPVTRPVASAADLAAAALEQLVGGPGSSISALKPVMPSTTRVMSLSMEGSKAVVDFSSDLAEAEDLDVAVAAIVLTLTELPGISSVKLTMGGQDIQMPDGKVLSEVFRPVSINPLAF